MEGSRAVTLVDVSQAAGVSRATASRALGGAGRISPTTRAHVQEVARQLGYVANPAARHLQRGRKGAIGLYLPDRLTGYAFYLELAFGAAAAGREGGFALTLLPTVQQWPITTLRAHVDGFVIVDPVVNDPSVPVLLDSGLPVVAAERHLDEDHQPRVTIESEHREALGALLDHVSAQGATSPALLNLDLDFSWTRIVEETYASWCENRGIPPRLRRIPASGDPVAVRRIARALLEDADPPDTIIAAPDGTALSVLGAARDVGRTVGTDVLVASGVDSLAMQYSSPPITAIDLRPWAIGRDAATALLTLLRGEDLPVRISRGRPELSIRESTTGLSGERPPTSVDADRHRSTCAPPITNTHEPM